MMPSKDRTFLVIGLGTFGYMTAEELFEHDAEVIALDHRQELVDKIRNQVSRAVCANATDEEVLETIGAFEVDVAVVALRNHFDTSVLVTHILLSNGVKDVHVQVNSEHEAGAVMALGARSAVFPEEATARNLAKQLVYPNLADILPLGKQIGIIEIPIGKAFEGKTLMDMNIRREHRVNVVAIKRKAKRRRHEEVSMIEPEPDEPLRSDDKLLLLGNLERLSRFSEFVKSKQSSEEEPETQKPAENKGPDSD